METDIMKKLEEQAEKLERISASVDKLRRYFFWTMVISLGAVLVPLIGIAVIMPWFLSVMTSAYTIQ